MQNGVTSKKSAAAVWTSTDKTATVYKRKYKKTAAVSHIRCVSPGSLYLHCPGRVTGRRGPQVECAVGY